MNSDNEKKQIQDSDDDVLRDHVFDGIQEYDKKLPNWWLMTFYGTIVFSIGYWFFYHISEAGMSPEEKFARTQARAAAFAAEGGGGDFSDERLIAMSADASLVGSGKSIFANNCAACHGPKAEGGIGPSLNDGTWIHGGLPSQIFQIIQEGVPAKGMPGWSSVLGEKRNAEITAFILSLNPEALENAQPNHATDGE